MVTHQQQVGDTTLRGEERESTFTAGGQHIPHRILPNFSQLLSVGWQVCD